MTINDKIGEGGVKPIGRGALMLISNSTNFGGSYLDHCGAAINSFLEEIREVVFIPFALKDHDRYAKIAEERFGRFGVKVISLHQAVRPLTVIGKAQAFFVGGGNTFRLLKYLQDAELLFPLRQRVENGAKYIGASAGSNLACPTIKTTNDMPIVEPRSLDALDLIGFQVNPHYLDFDSKFPHMGETRETRIKEFHEENDIPVIGLREGSWLVIAGGYQGPITLFGKNARIFLEGQESTEHPPGIIEDEELGL